MLGLNETGGFVWANLDGQASLREIAELVAKRWGISMSESLDHVLHFARLLLDRELVAVLTK